MSLQQEQTYNKRLERSPGDNDRDWRRTRQTRYNVGKLSKASAQTLKGNYGQEGGGSGFYDDLDAQDAVHRLGVESLLEVAGFLLQGNTRMSRTWV